MVNEKLINVFLYNTTKDNLITGIKAVLNHFKIDSEYEYESRVNNIVNIIGGDKIPTMEDIDMDLLKENIENNIYKAEEINKDSVKILNINPIDKVIKISFTRNNDDYARSELIKYDNCLKTVKEN